MRRRLNRKGGEYLHALFYTIFTSIMMMFSIVVIIVLASNIDPEMEYNTFNLRYNSMVSRTLYSPKCFAMEQAYTNDLGKTVFQILPGVVDMNKVTGEYHKTCLEGLNKGKNYDFAIAKLEVLQESSDSDATEEATDTSGEDTSQTGDETTQEEFVLNYIYGAATSCDIADWKRTGKYFVVIDEGGVQSKGLLTFCMNEV